MFAGIIWKLRCGWRSGHSIGAIRIALEESSCGPALASGKKQRTGGDEAGRAGKGLKLWLETPRTAEPQELRRRTIFAGFAQREN